MINKDNFKELLLHLDFKQDEIQGKMFTNVFVKQFPDIDTYLKVNLDEGELIFPEDKGLLVNTRTTCNFSQNENFVVFECIHNLFKQGYKPEHIELEPKWKLGHEAKSGRADILVKDFTNKPLLIIECKTSGNEFEKEWETMKQDGGQLFSYLKEERSTKFICLYASDFSENNLTFQNYIITTTDIQNLVEKYDKKPIKPLFYKDANNAKELYKAWKETYKLDYSQQGIFGEDYQAYNIGAKKLTLNSLQYIGKQDIQNKYNEFAKILRQHNVSGRENAFDKLVNLFLCKIVDETTNKTDLKFYWKGEYFDNYFDLLDRLQLLYSVGMKTFLEDEVTFIDFKTIKETFKFWTNDPDATQEKILEHFKKQKYFTNNDFSFIDVHNEKLFFQNADILLKLIKMWENYQINGEQQNQFLGDMFEGFLDKGVKQSEGQFFTPMPICKFIISSLPLEGLIKDNENPPAVIDYACGAGHFLTEFATQIKPYVEKYKNTEIKEYYKSIFGIEKEYRLSKVAKVSAFMYGQDEINILYADALAFNERIKENSFNVLIANPPYSVKGFLETIEADRDKYYLTLTIDPKTLHKNNTIEAFFIERAKQILKPKGIVGIILPISILSKGSQKSTSDKENTYVTTREILLKNFEFVSIAEFGQGTFGKTGVRTVILFLRKREDNPKPSEHYKSRVDIWFKNNNTRDGIYEDIHYLQKYCNHVEINFEDYKTLLEGKLNETLLNYDVFKEYTNDFHNSREINNLKDSYKKQIDSLEKNITSEISKEQKNSKTKLSEKELVNKINELVGIRKKELQEELDKEFEKRHIEFIQNIEKDKVLYFILAYTNNQKVLVMKCPDDTKERKNFLGYEWSDRKGSEGIKYIGVSINKSKAKSEDDDDSEDENIINNIEALSQIKTPLYDNDNSQNPEKINFHIQQNFLGNEVEIPETLKNYVSYIRLVDMIDFKRSNFDKVVLLNNIQTAEKNIETKWELKKLEDVASEIFAGGDKPDEFSEIKTTKHNIPVFSNSSENFGLFGYTNNARVIEPCVTVSARGTIGYTVYRTEPFFPIVRLIVIIPNKKYLFGKYLEIILNDYGFFNSGANIPQLTVPKISNIKIPLPPLDIQKKIVDECEKIEVNVEKSTQIIEKNISEIESLFNSAFNQSDKVYRLSDETNFDVSIGKRVLQNEVEQNKEGLPVYSANVFEPFGYIKKQLLDDFSLPSVIWGIDGDWMVNFIPANTPFYPTDHCGFLRIKSNEIHYRYLAWVLNKEGQNARFSRANRASIDRIKGIEIRVPLIGEQEKLVKEIEKLENQIAVAEKTISEAASKKNEIMKKYL